MKQLSRIWRSFLADRVALSNTWRNQSSSVFISYLIYQTKSHLLMISIQFTRLHVRGRSVAGQQYPTPQSLILCQKCIYQSYMRLTFLYWFNFFWMLQLHYLTYSSLYLYLFDITYFLACNHYVSCFKIIVGNLLS